MVIYFAIYCFLGYLMESLYISCLQKKWISSGLLKGPFIPLYGFGAVLLILLSPLFITPFLAFLIGGFIITLFEYLSSLYIEKYFHTKCWDYSNHRINIQGRVCLLYFIIWCLLSYLFLFFIHPFISSLSLINDPCCLLALIYLAFILKAFIEQIKFRNKNGLDIH